MPLIGLGRSSTMTSVPAALRRLHAELHRVDEGVVARADVLQVDDERVEIGEPLRLRAQFLLRRLESVSSFDVVTA